MAKPSAECTARVHEVTPTETMNPIEWFRAAFSPSHPCGQQAAWMGRDGPRCQEHAQREAEALMSDKTIIGMYMAEHGKRPETLQEAFERLFVPLS